MILDKKTLFSDSCHFMKNQYFQKPVRSSLV